MKKILILLVVALTSCKEKADHLIYADKIDSVTTTMVAKVDTIQEGPTKSFKTLVRFLDSLGYSSDTARVKRIRNYKELLDGDIILFDDFTFYKSTKKTLRYCGGIRLLGKSQIPLMLTYSIRPVTYGDTFMGKENETD